MNSDSPIFYLIFTEKFSDLKDDLKNTKDEKDVQKRSIATFEPVISALPLKRDEIQRLKDTVENSEWLKKADDKKR